VICVSTNTTFDVRTVNVCRRSFQRTPPHLFFSGGSEPSPTARRHPFSLFYTRTVISRSLSFSRVYPPGPLPTTITGPLAPPHLVSCCANRPVPVFPVALFFSRDNPYPLPLVPLITLLSLIFLFFLLRFDFFFRSLQWRRVALLGLRERIS